MARKVYLKPPPPTRTILWAQLILGVLFLPLGLVFVSISEGEARPFVAIFSVIWVVGCIAIIVSSIKTLRLVKQGKIEIAELSDTGGETESDFAVRLRDLEALRKDGLISEAEYQRKRAEILQEKW
ncbi:MAG: SHOCT domain-containing protein [Syntrophales bacterium]|nr:SHOCT domain-containing protein [Syntrophales bacterium]MDD5643437.1 SHOCT domain-containing protein [Syntrophales bacterium]